MNPHKNKKRMLPLLSILLLVCCAFSACVAQAGSGDGGPDRSYIQSEGELSPDAYYGRNALASLPNGEALLYAYDALVLGVSGCKRDISVNSGEYAVTEAELATVFAAYESDYPQHFWLEGGYSYKYLGDTVMSISPAYSFAPSDIPQAEEEFRRAADKLLRGLTDGMSEFERELYLHDALAAHITYDADAPNCHNAYGALVQGSAVCDGYAKAMQYLLYRAGLQSHMVYGESISSLTGENDGHAWNIVRIDGKYYHLDLTLDDQSKAIYHAYFNLTSDAILEDHSITQPEYGLPACRSTDAGYFTVKGGRVTDFDLDRTARMLRAGDLQAHVYFTGDVETFSEWYMKSISSIASRLGITGDYRYVYSFCGREVILSIYVPGDVSNDGTVDSRDVTRLLSKLAGSDTVRVSIPALDVNGDGEVTVADAVRLMRYLAGEDAVLW